MFSAFLLTQSATTVIYGKLSDVFGRRPVLLAGIVIFIVGSLLSGFATSMTALIAFRLLQGLGAGAIQPVTMTIVGDLFTLEERAKVQGIMSSVWAVSAVIGPLAGGIIVDHLPWAWIFWINVPVGILTIFGFVLFLKEAVVPRKPQIDYAGSVLFSIAIVALLVLLTEADGGLPILTALAAVFAVAGGLFVWQERRAPEPIISIALWAQRLIATSNAATLFAGMAMIGMTTVLPLYVQGVMGRTTIVAGFTLTALVVGWPLAVMLASRFFKRFGINGTLRGGSLLLPIGAAFLLPMTPDSNPADGRGSRLGRACDPRPQASLYTAARFLDPPARPVAALGWRRAENPRSLCRPYHYRLPLRSPLPARHGSLLEYGATEIPARARPAGDMLPVPGQAGGAIAGCRGGVRRDRGVGAVPD